MYLNCFNSAKSFRNAGPHLLMQCASSTTMCFNVDCIRDDLNALEISLDNSCSGWPMANRNLHERNCRTVLEQVQSSVAFTHIDWWIFKDSMKSGLIWIASSPYLSSCSLIIAFRGETMMEDVTGMSKIKETKRGRHSKIKLFPYPVGRMANTSDLDAEIMALSCRGFKLVKEVPRLRLISSSDRSRAAMSSILEVMG